MSTAADWGPSAWKFLHTLTYSYPDEPSLLEQQHAENLFQSLSFLLPCEKCREHYVREITNNPPNTTSKATLASWLVDIHNRVNIRLGKPIFSILQADQAYNSICTADCSSPSTEQHLNRDLLQSRQRNRAKDLASQTENGLYALCAILIFVAITLFWVKMKR